MPLLTHFAPTPSTTTFDQVIPDGEVITLHIDDRCIFHFTCKRCDNSLIYHSAGSVFYDLFDAIWCPKLAFTENTMVQIPSGFQVEDTFDLVYLYLAYVLREYILHWNNNADPNYNIYSIYLYLNENTILFPENIHARRFMEICNLLTSNDQNDRVNTVRKDTPGTVDTILSSTPAPTLETAQNPPPSTDNNRVGITTPIKALTDESDSEWWKLKAFIKRISDKSLSRTIRLIMKEIELWWYDDEWRAQLQALLDTKRTEQKKWNNTGWRDHALNAKNFIASLKWESLLDQIEAIEKHLRLARKHGYGEAYIEELNSHKLHLEWKLAKKWRK